MSSEAQPGGRRVSRRAFAAVVGGAVLSGRLVEAALQETAETGKLSSATARILLEHIGYPAADDSELGQLKPLIEETLKSLKVIREFDLPLTMEPACIFFPDR